MVVLYISIIMVMRVVQSVLGKQTSKLLSRNAASYLKYTAFYEAAAGIIACGVMGVSLLRGDGAQGIGETVLLAAVSGIALGATCILGKYLLCVTSMALSAIFGTAGLLIPCVASIFLFGEAMVWYQWIGIIVFMAGSYLLVGNAKKIYHKFTFKTLVLLLLNFGFNGITMLMQKLFGMRVDGGNTSLFSFVTFASAAIVAVIGFGVIAIVAQNERKKASSAQLGQEQLSTTDSEADAVQTTVSEKFVFIEADKKATRLPPIVFLYGTALAVAVFLINQLATISSSLIPAVVLFTIINGGGTIITAIVGAILYKEKLTVAGIIGLILGIGALILVQI